MFERVKCYKRLKRAEKFLRGSVVAGELLKDDKMVKEAKEALVLNAHIMKHMMLNRRMAKTYNLEFERNGFK